MERKTFFVDVVLPLALPRLYTYRIPFELNNSIAIGKRIIVQFGKKKFYSALIYHIHETPPQSYEAKYISSIIDDFPIINNLQIKLWKWISEYYLCSLGEVMKAALPAGLKISSETIILANPEFHNDFSLLDDKEYLVAEALQNVQKLDLSEVALIIEQKTVFPIIRALLEKGVIITQEELDDPFKPKTIDYIKFSEKYENEEEALHQLMDKIQKTKHQLSLIMAYIELSGKYKPEKSEVEKHKLLDKSSAPASSLPPLIKKGVFEIYKKVVGRLDKYSNIIIEPATLNEAQQKSIAEIKVQFLEKDVVLFHGVTSSGKTEIYVHLIQDALDAKKQVLYLLPEIALTSQIINRLAKFFGNKIGIYHSKFTDNERVEVWNNLLGKGTEKPQIILGVRSAIYLPFENLGLIIVDEEHENSFKQFDPAPRYHARDTAIFLAKLHNAKVLLGSATPSIESYSNALANKYGLVNLNSRFLDIQMPEIFVVDIRAETRKRMMKSHFSLYLLKAIEEALSKGEQVILFQNRRGFSPYVECHSCSWIPHCKHCDVTLTYHKHSNQLKCHYCGYATNLFTLCDACGSTDIRTKGFGTEKIEEDLAALLPDAKISRLDLDSTKLKNAYQRTIVNFEERRIDILIGTQMVTKGLDFDNVSLVGILNADNMLNYPDFRAFERSYQLMAQVSGRAGRKNKRGKVIIQTQNPKSVIIGFVVENNYKALYHHELLHRKTFHFPPFQRFVQITIKHKESSLLDKAAAHLANRLKITFGEKVLGPEYPIISRIQNYYLKDIIIKLDKDSRISYKKELLVHEIESMKQLKEYNSVRVVIDVDPM